ncbi:WD40-repeat-containing domain protein [Collybia nuda]|uniref:WD40-repeat-containing domain protein n=1 Tax=Collybia nuda TaxID=64659 RepID=A0A9P6CG89_9AGAR|nr:WD40-repeat-containing domain protein [Collybia nuda]
MAMNSKNSKSDQAAIIPSQTLPPAYQTTPSSSIHITAIVVILTERIKGSLIIRLLVDGEDRGTFPFGHDYDPKNVNLPLRWEFKPYFTLQSGHILDIQLRRRHVWRRSLLIGEVKLSFQEALRLSSLFIGKEHKLRDDPKIMVEFASRPDTLQNILGSSSEKAREKRSVLDHLNHSKRFLETILGFGVALSELDPIAKAVLACVDVVYKNLDDQDNCEKVLLDLAESMAATLGYIEDVEQFARLYQLRKSIEEVRPLMEDTANFILMFTSRSSSSAFVNSWRDRDKVDELAKRYKTFKQQFDRGLAVQSGANLETLLEAITSAKDDNLLLQLKPSGLDDATPMGECMRGTRLDIIASFDSWVQNIDATNILWIQGFPGVGKSAVASTLVGRLRDSQRLGSNFVFERTKSTVTTTPALWRNVAFDLARTYPAVRKVVIQKLDEEVVQLGSPNVKMLFRNIIEEPLRASEDIPPGRLPVVVIDALDECGGLDGRQSTHRVSLLQSLKLWSRLPSRFKLVVTSRSEDDIVRVLSSISYPIDLSSGTTVADQATQDIRLFLTSRFAKIAKNYPDSLSTSWPGDEAIGNLTNRAAGLFIWAKTATEFVDAGEPKEQLRQILKGSTELGDVAALYAQILHTSFKDPSQEVIQSFKNLVGATGLARVPLRRAECISLIEIEPTMLDFIRKGLQSVMDAGDTLRFNHHSFVDFLIDPKKCPTPFLIDKAAQHKALAHASLKIMKQRLRFNICNLETSHLRNKDIFDLDDQIRQNIPDHLSYSCRFWAEHLRASRFDTELLQEVQEFLNERLLYWLEVLSLTKELNVVVSALSSIIRWCKGEEAGSVPSYAKDAIKFMSAFGPVISQSVPHIYLSALPFTPTTSLVSQRYLSRFPQTLSLQTGRVTDWPAIQYVAEGHADSVNSVAFSRNGKYLVSGSTDKTIRLWDTETGGLVIGPFKGHKAPVSSVTFSYDSRRIASGSYDFSVRIWEVDTGELAMTPLEGHTGPITSISFSRDGRQVVSGSEDKTLRIWDVDEAELAVKTLTGHKGIVTSVAFSQDQKHVVSGSTDKTIIVWNAKTGTIISGPLEGHTFWVNSVGFSPNGKRIVSGSNDHTIMIWDTITGTPLIKPFKGHLDGVTSVAYSQDGRRIVSGSYDETVRIWDAETGNHISGPFQGHTDSVMSVAFSWNGRRIASASHDKTIRVWDTAARDITDSLVAGPFTSHTDGVNSVAFSPDGQLIVSGSDDVTVRVWDVKTGHAKFGPFKGHTSWIDTVAFSHDGKHIASGSDDRTILLWNIEEEKVIGRFVGHTGGVTSVAFSPDDMRIASGSYDKTIRIWGIRTLETILEPFEGHTGWVTSISFSSDGKRIASGSYDKTIRIWNVGTGALVAGPFYGHKDGVNSVAFSPNGDRVVSGSGDETIMVWDAHSGNVVAGPFLGHTTLVISVAYSRDGRYIVSGSDDRTIRLWDAETGSLIVGPLEGHGGGVDSVAFSPDGKSIVSGSEDATIRVWSVSPHPTGSLWTPAKQLADDWRLENGWVLSSDMTPLFWVPPWNRAGLWWPRNTSVVAEISTKLDFNKFTFGSSWQHCRGDLT